MATIAVASSLVLASLNATHAQDGTGGAPPLEETNCVLVPASDIDELRDAPGTTPVASPTAIPASETANATPAMSQLIIGTGATPVPDSSDATPIMAVSEALLPPDATPEASPAAEPAIPIDEEALTEDLVAASTSFTSCLSEGQFDQVVDHTSAIFRGQLAGNGRPLPGDVYVSLAETFPPVSYSILEVLNPALVDDATATADVVWQLANQVRVDQWTFTLDEVQGLTIWTVEMAAPGTATPSIESTTITTTISGNRYSLDPATVADDTVLFDVTNNDAVDHELLVLQLAPDLTTDVLLTTPGPQLPEGVTMVGQATIAQNSAGRLMLTGLEPGTYTIVCLLIDETGVPYLADGMEATFTVQAP